MARVELVDVDRMNVDERAQYDRFPSNLTRALLLADPRLAKALPEVANAIRASSLDGGLREAAILRVAALHGSAYERMQHLDQARKAGWSDEDIAKIEAGEAPAKVADALRFVDECVRTGDVSDAAFDALHATLNPREIADLLLLIGHYMTVARFTAVLRVELDAHADSWSREH